MCGRDFFQVIYSSYKQSKFYLLNKNLKQCKDAVLRHSFIGFLFFANLNFSQHNKNTQNLIYTLHKTFCQKQRHFSLQKHKRTEHIV